MRNLTKDELKARIRLLIGLRPDDISKEIDRLIVYYVDIRNFTNEYWIVRSIKKELNLT